MIKSCAISDDLECEIKIHDAVRWHKNITLKTALMDFNGQCRRMEEAQNVFDSIHELDRDIVAVNALMNGSLYAAMV